MSEETEVDGARPEDQAFPRGFDGYRLLRRLGSGGQGVVYEAEEEATGRRVAIKLLRSGELAGEEERERFLREARLAGGLDDPNVVRVLGYGSVRGLPYLVLELVDGRPLLEHLSEAQPTLRARVDLIAQACRGVAHAHRRGVIHRDLKPQNLLVTGEGLVKVVDFGTARLLDEAGLTRSGQFIGTLRDAAPEQVAGGEVDTRTDVHALGLLLYRALADRHPWGDIGETEGLSGVTRAVESLVPKPPSKWNPEVDRDLDAICLQALAKQPEDRQATVEDLLRDLEAWREGRPVAARRGGAAYRAWKLARRHPLRVGLGTAAVAVLAGLIGFALVQGARAETERLRAERESAHLQQLLDYATRLLSVQGSTRQAGASSDNESALRAAYEYLTREERMDHPAAIKLWSAMGDLLVAAGHADRATDMYRKVRTSPGAAGGADPAESASLALRHARASLESGSTKHAAEAAAEALGHLEACAEPPAGVRAEALLLLARTALEEGRREEALALHEELSGWLEASPHEVVKLRSVLRHRCELLAELGRDDEALELLDEHFARHALPLEGRDALDLRLRTQHASLLLARGRAEEALPQLRTAVGLQQEILGPSNSILLRPVVQLAAACAALSRWHESLAWTHDALRIRLTHQGPLHPDIARLRLIAGELEALIEPGSEASALTLQRAREEEARLRELGLLEGDAHRSGTVAERLALLAKQVGDGA